ARPFAQEDLLALRLLGGEIVLAARRWDEAFSQERHERRAPHLELLLVDVVGPPTMQAEAGAYPVHEGRALGPPAVRAHGLDAPGEHRRLPREAARRVFSRHE